MMIKFKLIRYFISLSIILFSQTSLKPDNKLKLNYILDKSAEYCQKLKLNSYKYYCLEEINQSTLNGKQKKYYLCDYQFIKKQNRIIERRTILKAHQNGKEINQDKLELRFLHEKMFLGPYGLLSKKWQKEFEYTFLKKGHYKGIPVFIIKSTPKSGILVKHLWGKIWIEQKDFSIIKIEFSSNMIKKESKLIQYFSKILKANPVIKTSIEFNKKHSGIRYPTFYQFDESYIGENSIRFSNNGEFKIIKYYLFNAKRRTHLSKITAKYFQYNFFSVKISDVKYEEDTKSLD